MVTAGRDLSLRRVDADGDGMADDMESALGRRWHHVVVVNSGRETSLIVDRLYRSTFVFDDESEPKRGDGSFMSDGNSSYVYVGGLPAWYDFDDGDSSSAVLALPLVLMHPRFRGRIRGVRYEAARTRSKEEVAGPQAQEMMAYKVRSFSPTVTLIR